LSANERVKENPVPQLVDPRVVIGLAHLEVTEQGVSKAIYLRDPDNNGVKLYRDRPRA